MNSEQFYEIVVRHRDAWPSKVQMVGKLWVCDTLPMPIENAMLMFEASFHRAILARTNVSVDKWPDGYIVRVQSHSFDSPRLIEAYAKALEWLK